MDWTSAQILVVDDDQEICTLISDVLQDDGYAVTTCHTGTEAMRLLRSGEYVLLLADIKLPDIDGMELLRYVRTGELGTQVILMTAYASIETAIQALRDQAFDYVKKPFSLPELRRRASEAVQKGQGDHPLQHDVVHIEHLTIDLSARRVWVNGSEVRLTRLEFDVLNYLYHQLGCTVSVDELLEEVWLRNGREQRSIDTVRSCIRRLRQKISIDSDSESLIENVWGVGYQLGD